MIISLGGKCRSDAVQMFHFRGIILGYDQERWVERCTQSTSITDSSEKADFSLRPSQTTAFAMPHHVPSPGGPSVLQPEATVHLQGCLASCTPTCAHSGQSAPAELGLKQCLRGLSELGLLYRLLEGIFLH